MSTVATQASNGVPKPSPPAITPLFTHTSQYESYLLTPTELQQQLSSSTSRSASYIDSASCILIQQYYLYRIPLLGKAFGLNERVISTAMTYFKRYWLGGKHSLAGEDRHTMVEPILVSGKSHKEWRGGKGVKLVMLVCLYLSTKTHSSPVSLHSFASLIQSPKPNPKSASAEEKQKWEDGVRDVEAAIRDHEFQVASVLGWKFRVVHAFEGVRGIALDLQTLDDGKAQEELTPALLDKCMPILNTTCAQLRLTNAEFVYTPSQLALGVWWSVFNVNPNEEGNFTSSELQTLTSLLSRWVESKEQLDTTGSVSYKSLTNIANAITNTEIPGARNIEARLKSKETLEEVKKIDLKLKECIVELDRKEAEEGESKKRKGDGEESTRRNKTQKVDSDDSDDDV